MVRLSVYPWETVCNINYLENLVRVIQRFMPSSIHSRADKIYNFKWCNTLGTNAGIFFLNPVKTLGTQLIIRNGRKPEAKVFIYYALVDMCMSWFCVCWQLAHRPKPNYMRRQTDITSNMRSILVDWLVEVADEYKLHRETLFLAVDFVDRFLSVMAVQRQKLQLVGAAAMFIAA